MNVPTLLKAVLLAGLTGSAMLGAVSAQAPPPAELQQDQAYVAKFGSGIRSIFRDIQVGQALMLIVELEPGDAVRYIFQQQAFNMEAARRQAESAQGDAKALAAIEDKARKTDQALDQQMSSGLRALKASVFPDGRLGDATVAQDFDALPVLLVRVPNHAALLRLLDDPRVKHVNRNGKVEPV